MKYRYICNNCGHRFTSNYEDECCPVCYDNDIEIIKANQPVASKEENDYYYLNEKRIRSNNQFKQRRR